MVSSPDDEDAASSLHVLLVSNLPLGSLQTSPSVKSTERLSPNIDHSNDIQQLPEFLVWYPLPGVGGGAPQLLNKSPAGRELLVYSKTMGKGGRRVGDGDDEHNNSRRSSSKLAAGESIAIGTAATGATGTTAEIVVPIHSAEKRRWRLGYYVVAPRYPRETIAKLLGGGQREMSPVWFSSRDADLSSASGEKDGEDVEMEEAAATADDEEEEEDDDDDDDDEDGDYEGSSSSDRVSPPAPRKSAREARAERRRRRRRRQLAADDTNVAPRRRGVGRRATAAKGTKASGDNKIQDGGGSESEPEDTDDDEEDEGNEDEKSKAGHERSGHDSGIRSGSGAELTSLSMALPWAAVATAGGVRLEGRVDILPLGRPRPG